MTTTTPANAYRDAITAANDALRDARRVAYQRWADADAANTAAFRAAIAAGGDAAWRDAHAAYRAGADRARADLDAATDAADDTARGVCAGALDAWRDAG